MAIGLSRIGGNPGGPPYPYGSNLVANHRGWFLSWPAGAPVPKSGWIRPWGLTPSPFLVSWYTAAEWTMSQVVPLTLYDPALWFADLSNLHTAAWNGASNGWYATWDQSAPVIIRNRGTCPTPALKPLVDNVLNLEQ